MSTQPPARVSILSFHGVEPRTKRSAHRRPTLPLLVPHDSQSHTTPSNSAHLKTQNFQPTIRLTQLAMKGVIVAVDLIECIASRTPKKFFQLAVEGIESAYAQAERETQTYEQPERRRIRPQIRAYRQNAALRNAGQEAGLASTAADTSPKGEKYALVYSQDLVFGRVGVNFSDRIPRAAKHRSEIAALNDHLEPKSFDLFDDGPRVNTETGLGILLVTVNPHHRDAQDIPARIIVGVPYTNMKGWHLFEPVSSFFAALSESSELIVPDNAIVLLKKSLKRKEDDA